MNLSGATALSFARTTGVYLLGTILSKISAFLLLPIYTLYISPGDYGYYDLSLTYVTVIASALFFDVWMSVMRFMYDDSSSEKSKTIRAGFSVFGISSIAYIILAGTLLALTDIKYLGLIAVYGIALNIANMFSFVARGFGENKSFAISGVLSSLAASVLGVILVAVLKMDFSALYLSVIAGCVVQVLYLQYKVGIIGHIFSGESDLKLTKNILFYTLPLFINSIAYWLMTSYNRIVINNELTIEDNGLYAVASKFILVIGLLTTVFSYAWQDMSYSRASGKAAQKFYSKASRAYIMLLGVGSAIILPAFYLAFPFIVGSSYEASKNLLPLLVVMAALSAFVVFLGGIFHAIKNTKTIFYSMLVACIANILICIPLVQHLGLNGATLATIASLLICVIFRAYSLKGSIDYRLRMMPIILLGLWLAVTSCVYIMGNWIANVALLMLNLCIAIYIFRGPVYGLLKFVAKKIGKDI